MKDFVINTFNHVNISVNCSRAGLILFAGGARIEFNLNEYTDEASLRNAVNSTKYKKLKGFRQGTDTPAALNLMRTAARAESGGNYLGLRNGVPHIAVFITDGRPNLNYLKPPKISKTEADQMTERAGRLLHDANIYDQIYAIGIQGEKGEIRDTLRFIADPPELTFLIENFSQERFDEAVANITRQFCDPCILSPCPNGSICRICRETGIRYCEFTCAVDNGGCDEGSRCIEVNVPTCSPGQCCSPVNITCQACVVGKVDCVYILDVSLSINNDSNFGLIRNLITQSAHQLTIGNDDVLFAVILFAHHAWINFTIPQYTNRMDLIDAVNNISYYDTSKLNRTGTNIPEALNLLREAGKDDRLGLRSDANYKHAIFITDGRTNTRPIEKERIGRKLTKKEKEQIDNIDIKNSIDAANELHDSGIYDDIFAIGIRGQHDVDIEELSHIASRPEFRLEIQNFTLEAFQAVIQQLSEELCNPCTELQCPNGSICRVCNHTGMPYCEYSCTIDNGGCSQGARCVEQTAECASDECCSPVVTCGTCDVGEVDFVFILDNSKSIKNDGNFGFMKKLVIQFAEVVDFGVENALFSVVTFARHAWINFPITEHITRADLIKTVNQTSYFDLPELNRTGTNMREVLDLLITAGESDGGLKLRGPEVPKIAIFITDGRPNTKDLTGNTLQEDSIETHNAAARLHESGIFNQIYAAGIKGQKDINFEELAFIASDPGLIFLIQDFNLQLFRQLQSYLITAICGRENCTVQGQIYLQEAPPPECQPTCSHPTRDCHSTAPRPGCVCPEDTVIDETQNRCVPIPQCTCPPQCSHDYCSSPLVQNSDTLIPCMRGSPPYTEASCTDDCQLTYCQACYYSRRPLRPPSGCSGYRNEPKGCLCCLREWTRCVERRNKRDNECTGDCQTITNFRCYEYPLCIIRNP